MKKLLIALGILALAIPAYGRVLDLWVGDGTGAVPATNADVEFDREFVIYDLSVQAVDAGGASAVAVGDVLYYDGTNILNKNNAGEEYGVALEVIAAGIAVINVMLMSSG